MCYPVLLFKKTKQNPELIKLQGEMANLGHRLKVSICGPLLLLHGWKLWQNKITHHIVGKQKEEEIRSQ